MKEFDTNFLEDISNNEIFSGNEAVSFLNIQNAVDWYINVLSTHFQENDSWLDPEFERTCITLFDSKLYTNFRTQVISWIIKRTLKSCDSYPYPKELWVEFSLLTFSGQLDSNTYKFCKNKSLFPHLSKVILKATDPIIQFTAIFLSSSICQSYGVESIEILGSETKLFNVLIDYIEKTADNKYEYYTLEATKLMILLDSQCQKFKEKAKRPHKYLTSFLRSSSEDLSQNLHQKKLPVSQLILLLIDRGSQCKTLISNIIFLLNREIEETLLEAILIFLTGVFQCERVDDLFFLNDFYVLIDILLRELSSTSENNYKILQLYLLTISAAIQTSRYSSVRYKLDEITLLLVEMLRKSLESHTEPGSDVEPSLDSFSGDLTSAKSTTSDNVLKNTQFIHGRRAT